MSKSNTNMAFTKILPLLMACILSLNVSINAQPLEARNTTALTSSCTTKQSATPLRGGPLLGPWHYTILIYNKQTPERGAPAQGLIDNIVGECHAQVDPASPPHVDPFGYNPQTHALSGYNITFSLPASLPDTACVQTAIKKAENKDLDCGGW